MTAHRAKGSSEREELPPSHQNGRQTTAIPRPSMGRLDGHVYHRLYGGFGHVRACLVELTGNLFFPNPFRQALYFVAGAVVIDHKRIRVFYILSRQCPLYLCGYDGNVVFQNYEVNFW